jgi:hypothetical protein
MKLMVASGGEALSAAGIETMIANTAAARVKQQSIRKRSECAFAASRVE